MYLRRLRRETCDNACAITNILQTNVVVGIVVGALLLAPAALCCLLWPLSQDNRLGVCLLDVPEPSAQVGHQVLLDESVCDAVLAQRLPDRGVGIGDGVANNVGPESKVGIELLEAGLNLLEVERLKCLGTGLPLGDLGVHGVGCGEIKSSRRSFGGMMSVWRGSLSIEQVQFHTTTIFTYPGVNHDGSKKMADGIKVMVKRFADMSSFTVSYNTPDRSPNTGHAMLRPLSALPTPKHYQ